MGAAGYRLVLAILCAWARQTNLPDQYRWNLRPEMNVLDNPES